MASRIKGITIEFNGDTTKLDKAIRNIDKNIKNVDKSLRDVNRLTKFNPRNSELAAQKYEMVSNKVKEYSERLKLLKKADEDAKKQLEKGDLGQEEYAALRREIIETESKLNHFKKELDSLKNYNIQNLGEQFKNIGEKIQNAGSKIKDFGKSLTTKVTLPLVGVGVAVFKTAADLEDAMGASDEIFKGSSDEVKNWADKLESYYGIAKGDAVEYANETGALLKNLGGLSEEEAAKQSILLTELAGDLSAMFGGSTEEAVNALTSSLQGNNKALSKYGIGINEVAIKNKAMEMGIYEGSGAMTFQQKQAATLALIMEQTADAQGQAKREADGASGSMKAFTTTIKNLASDIGEVLLPIITPMLQKVTEWIEKFKELDPHTKETIVKVGMLARAIGPLLLIIGTLITSIGSITSAIGGLMTFVAANPIVLIIGAIVAAAILLIANWDKVKEKAQELWQNLTETWENIKTSISGKIDNIKTAVSEKWESIKTTVSTKVEGIKTSVSTKWESIKTTVGNKVDSIKENVSTKWENIKTTVGDRIDEIKEANETGWGSIKEKVSTKLGDMKEDISTKFQNIKEITKTTWENIKRAVTEPFQKAFDKVKRLIDRIKKAFDFKIEFPKFKLPHISVTKAKGLFGIPYPKFSVNWYKEGGIFDQPSIIGVGEAGEETVLPTKKLDQFLEDAVKRISVEMPSSNSNGIVINIDKMEVRDDKDIEEFARRLEVYVERKNRGF